MKKTDSALLIRVSSYDWALIECYIAQWLREADPRDEIQIAVLEQWVTSFDWDSDEDPDSFIEHRKQPDWFTRNDELWPETWGPPPEGWADNEEVQS